MKLFRSEKYNKNLWFDFFVTKKIILFCLSMTWEKSEIIYKNKYEKLRGLPFFGLFLNFSGFFSFFVFLGRVGLEFRFLEPNVLDEFDPKLFDE